MKLKDGHLYQVRPLGDIYDDVLVIKAHSDDNPPALIIIPESMQIHFDTRYEEGFHKEPFSPSDILKLDKGDLQKYCFKNFDIYAFLCTPFSSFEGLRAHNIIRLTLKEGIEIKCACNKVEAFIEEHKYDF